MKKRALDKVYEEIDTKFKDMPDDKMQESIDAEVEKLQEEMENIQKQIDGMEASEKGLDDETRERLEKEIDKKSKKINNLEGYRKNKTQITKIIEYREKLETKLSETITARDDSKKAYGEAKKELDEVNKILKDEEAARDVVQEVFIRFYEKSYDFPNLIALKSFLYSCVQSKALNALEKQNTRTFLKQRLDTPEYEEATYFRHQIEAEIFEEIFAAIEELPSECRRIFKMSYLEHMDIREITEKLQIAESTVKTQRQRAKQYLRKRLKNLYTLVIFLFFE